MSLNANTVKAPNTNKNKAEPLDAGNYMGRVVQVLDLGLQPQRAYQGQDKPPANEIMITYELGTEFLKDEDGKDLLDKPRWVSETIPLYSLDQDLAKSTKRYNALDPSGALNGDFSQLVGLPCTITVVKWRSKTDATKEGNNVGHVSLPMKGFPVPELVNPPKTFDLDTSDVEVFGSMPEWLQDKIKANLNYQGSLLQEKLEGANPVPVVDYVPSIDDCAPY